jgi:hypothetical protein
MNSYKVKDQKVKTLHAYLEHATVQDIVSTKHLNFKWKAFWDNADPRYEKFIKLSHQNKILGFIHFGVYTYQHIEEQYIYIDHLECINKQNRSFEPVGFWLIWYVVKYGLTLKRDLYSNNALIKLDSLEQARFYYQNKVRMREQGSITLAPGEDGYAFEFSVQESKEFCRRIESEYGTPELI